MQNQPLDINSGYPTWNQHRRSNRGTRRKAGTRRKTRGADARWNSAPGDAAPGQSVKTFRPVPHRREPRPPPEGCPVGSPPPPPRPGPRSRPSRGASSSRSPAARIASSPGAGGWVRARARALRLCFQTVCLAGLREGASLVFKVGHNGGWSQVQPLKCWRWPRRVSKSSHPGGAWLPSVLRRVKGGSLRLAAWGLRWPCVRASPAASPGVSESPAVLGPPTLPAEGVVP